jgi:preprotein translocase subunit SecG
MYTFLLIILIITSFVVIAAVLLQAGKGGGIAASFGGASTSSDSLIGTRQAGNLLTKVSWWGGGLQLMSVRTRTPQSILDQPLGTAPAPTTAPPAAQKGAPPSAVPVVPLEKDGKAPTPKSP